jgi:hypothetical protein
MPTLTIPLSEAELAAAERAAAQHHLTRNEFARQALSAASEKKRAFRGALKGRYTYKQAMKLLRG